MILYILLLLFSITLIVIPYIYYEHKFIIYSTLSRYIKMSIIPQGPVIFRVVRVWKNNNCITRGSI